ncbi:hypothetical protein BDW59DRAFT_138262 [Aspergillus cavernicola]|uniref:Uncharacterized protein n=1 Tax=Aspergillus cavernicola TaxID=176166 RepID=A0ABR4J1J5_9EURO
MAGTMLGTGAATTTATSSNYSNTASETFVALLILRYCVYRFTRGPGCWVIAGEVGPGQLPEWTLFLASIGTYLRHLGPD